MMRARYQRSLAVMVNAALTLVLAGWVYLGNADTRSRNARYPLSLFAQAKADDYIGSSEPCAGCHKPHVESYLSSPHAQYMADAGLPADKRGCEGCHGPGNTHMANLEDPDKIRDHVIAYSEKKPKVQSDACLRCHEKTMTQAHWEKTGHAKANIACTSCHYIHVPAEGGLPADREQAGKLSAQRLGDIARREFTARPDPKHLLRAPETELCAKCHRREAAEFRLNFHHPVPEGRLTCSDCHDVHPARTATKRMRTVKDSCITCHPQMAGPFAFEHDATGGLAGDGCNECHRPHGSVNPKLLTHFSRGVCNQCHTDQANNHNPGRNCWETGCHAAIHGSNSDRLFLQP